MINHQADHIRNNETHPPGPGPRRASGWAAASERSQRSPPTRKASTPAAAPTDAPRNPRRTDGCMAPPFPVASLSLAVLARPGEQVRPLLADPGLRLVEDVLHRG